MTESQVHSVETSSNDDLLKVVNTKIETQHELRRDLRWLPLDLFFMMRPSQFIPIWATLTSGFVFASLSQSGDYSFNSIGFTFEFWIILLSVSMGSGAVFIYNQISDIETDKLNGKLLFLPKSLVTKHEAIWTAHILISTALIIGYMVSGSIFFIYLICGIIGYLYNSKPAEWKNKPILSIVVNFLGGWLCFLTGAVLLEPISLNYVFAGLAYALSWSAVFCVVTIPDQFGDKKSNKITMSVKYGAKTTKIVALVMILLSFLVGVIAKDPVFIFSAIAAIPFYFRIIRIDNHGIFTPVKLSFLFLIIGSSYFAPFFLLTIFLVFAITKVYYQSRFKIDYPSFSSKK